MFLKSKVNIKLLGSVKSSCKANCKKNARQCNTISITYQVVKTYSSQKKRTYASSEFVVGSGEQLTIEASLIKKD